MLLIIMHTIFMHFVTQIYKEKDIAYGIFQAAAVKKPLRGAPHP